MKFQIKNIFAFLVMALVFTSCTHDEVVVTPPVDELLGTSKFKEIANATHTIELYSHMEIEQGFNEIKIRIKDNATNQYVKNAAITWTPLMHMSGMTHSCPKSAVEKISTDGDVYEGYIVFQMAENTMEYWDLKIDYTINGTSYTITTPIGVPVSDERRVEVFTGSDNVKYIVAYIEPHHPKVALNDLVVGVWKMQDMMTFPVVDGYTVRIDPRMPSMGNHGTPNNVHATQTFAGGAYTGKMAITMTGAWQINLQLVNASGTVLKGEEITSSVTGSSIFFDLVL